MNDNSCCFEPTVTLNGIPTSPYGCQALIMPGKAEVLVAVTHLALARSQKTRTVILGNKPKEFFGSTKEKSSRKAAFFYDVRE